MEELIQRADAAKRSNLGCRCGQQRSGLAPYGTDKGEKQEPKAKDMPEDPGRQSGICLTGWRKITFWVGVREV